MRRSNNVALILIALTLLAVSCSSTEKSSKRRRGPSRQEVAKVASDNKYNKLSLAIRSGQDREVEAATSAILAKEPHDVITLNALAMHHYRKGRVGLTKILLKQAIDQKHDSASIQNNLGLIYMDEGNLTAASNAFKEALLLDEQNLEAAANLGGIYAGYGDCDKAIPLLENAYSNKYRPVDVMAHLGICYGAVGRAEAESLFKQALSQDIKNSRVLYNVSVYWLVRRNSPQQAQTFVRRLRTTNIPADLVNKVAELEREINKHMQISGG